jgi:hypothetical protein
LPAAPAWPTTIEREVPTAATGMVAVTAPPDPPDAPSPLPPSPPSAVTVRLVTPGGTLHEVTVPVKENEHVVLPGEGELFAHVGAATAVPAAATNTPVTNIPASNARPPGLTVRAQTRAKLF